MIATALSFLAGNKIARYALIAALVVGAVLLMLGRAKRQGEAVGRLAEALATSETSNEAMERMNEALAKPTRGRDAIRRRLRSGSG